MTTHTTYTGEQLVSALHALGVEFIMGGTTEKRPNIKKPESLIAALANNGEARIRLSLIPLFLEHPEFSRYVRSVSDDLDPANRVTLQCYYSAAVWLQQQYRVQLDVLIGQRPALPDQFSSVLGLEITADCEENLRRRIEPLPRELAGDLSACRAGLAQGSDGTEGVIF